eukprot:412988_1
MVKDLWKLVQYVHMVQMDRILDFGMKMDCKPYSDTTNYKPNYKKENSWIPLIEDNCLLYIFFIIKIINLLYNVTPHIGKTAVTKAILRQQLKNKCISKPNYDYVFEKQLVINRLADLAINDTKKMLVEFFDNKLNVALAMLKTMDEILQWSLEERIHWMVGYTATEYDAVIQAWKSKIKYDLIRPTSLIKADGNKKIITYGGPNKRLQEIRSKDFESYFRVMPHSEYPSGSGCLCIAATQFTDLYLKNRYDITNSVSITLPFTAGSSLIEPHITPMQDLLITFKDLTEYRNICGESRLWGGMHFTNSVLQSYELCDGLGQTGYEYAEYLLNGHPL